MSFVKKIGIIYSNKYTDIKAMNILKPLRNIIYTGTDSITDPQLKKSIILTNKILVTGSFSSFPYFFIFHWFGLSGLRNSIIIVELFMIGCLLLNRFKKYNLSRLMTLLSINGIILYNAFVAGKESGIHLLLYATICLPMILFKIENVKSILFGLAQPVIGMVAFYLLNEMGIQSTPLPAHVSKIIHLLMIPTIFVLFGTSTLYFYFENFHSEKRLRENNDLLEKANIELKSYQEKLVQSAKMSALGEMAGGIAHEINSPLAAISLRIDQMIETINNSEASPSTILTSLEKVKKVTGRIAHIVSGLKYFARENKNDSTSITNLEKILEETLNLCRERFLINGVELRLDNEEKVRRLEIECYPVQISQVLLNLLNNAYDAIETLPEKWIQIQFKELDEFMEIAVIDSGSGIPPEIQAKMMQPFFTTKEIGKGTGLGLSISMGIIQNYKGKLFIDNSHPNTKFVVHLPKRKKKSKSLVA